MPIVIGKYCEKDLPVARIWLRSWKNRGWKTRIGFGNVDTSLRIINFSMRPPKGAPRGVYPVKFKAKRYGARGWQNAELVKFPPGSTEETILNCGREI